MGTTIIYFRIELTIISTDFNQNVSAELNGQFFGCYITMPGTITDLPAGVQRVAADAPLEYILRLLKRDGGVFVKNFISEEDADKAYSECKERIDNDMEWEGEFFPSQYITRKVDFICQNEKINVVGRGDKTGTWTSWVEPNIHEDSIDAPIVSRSVRPLPYHKNHVLVGRRTERISV